MSMHISFDIPPMVKNKTKQKLHICKTISNTKKKKKNTIKNKQKKDLFLAHKTKTYTNADSKIN